MFVAVFCTLLQFWQKCWAADISREVWVNLSQ